MRRISTASSAFASSFLALASSCFGADEYISFGQSPSKDAFATIQGNVPFCDSFIGWGFVGLPEVTLSQQDIAIQSVAAGGDCNPGPPPYPPPVSYHMTVSLGALADGQYLVTWTYTLSPAIPVITTRALLSVESGEVAIFVGSFE